ncbi:hypothetical protein BDZ91DRAFT_743269 [Kalaharituber pfeilii]|nr:hypothetical protein BDZ91DRAFT_743269 [Kalaharituber pfeilii]
MRIRLSLVLVLGLMHLVASQSSTSKVYPYPMCMRYIGGSCIDVAMIATSCLNDPTPKCACSNYVNDFFVYLMYCASAMGCSTEDINETLRVASTECADSGYDVDYEKFLHSPIPSQPIPSFSIPNLNLPTYSFPTPSDNSGGDDNFGNRMQDPTSPGLDGGNSGGKDDGGDGGGISTGAIIGIAVGVVVTVAIAAGLIIFCAKRNAKQKRLNALETPSAPPPAPPAPAIAGTPYYQPSAAGYPPQQQPLMQHHYQQQQYQELEQPNYGYFAPQAGDEKHPGVIGSTAPATPAPVPTGQAMQQYQELDTQPIHDGHVYAEMPANPR